MADRLLQSLSRLGDLQPVDWLRYMGFLVWLLTAVPLLVLPLVALEPPGTGAIIGWWSGSLLFLLAFIHPAVRLQQRSPFWLRVLLLAVMSVAAFAVNYFTRSGIGSLLAMVVAALLPWMLPALPGMAWVGALALVFGIWVIFTPDGTWLLALIFVLMNLGLTLFPFIASLLALQQVQARADLRRVNSELLATQTLLADNTRIAERVRISRDLHDLVGHHLTALTLNLEVASHTTEGKAKSHVERQPQLRACCCRTCVRSLETCAGMIRSTCARPWRCWPLACRSSISIWIYPIICPRLIRPAPRFCCAVRRR